MFTKEELEVFYTANLRYKKKAIYDYLNALIDYNKPENYYLGMLTNMSLLMILIDAHSEQLIFSGVQQIWMRNTALVILDRLLVEDNVFGNLDEISL